MVFDESINFVLGLTVKELVGLGIIVGLAVVGYKFATEKIIPHLKW